MHTTTATTAANHTTATPSRRRRSILGRAAVAALPALIAATAFAPSAGAMMDRNPDFDDPGTSAGSGSTGTTSNTCSTTGTRYRVTLTKFRVTSQTYDNFMQTDGKGDEVFLSWQNVKVAANGAILANLGSNTSVVMGDRNGFTYRERAGSLSDQGGLQAGDVHTTNKVLWEGSLQNGQAVVITPTIWEWDGGGDGFQAWSSWASKLASRLSSRAGELFGEEVGKWIDLADIGLESVASMPIGSSGDKPIGSAGGGSSTTFTPQMLVLDPASIAHIMNDNPVGEGRCVVGVEYAGTNDHGRYTLYVEVERY